MPKNKKHDSSESDSGPEDRNPPSKKSKSASKSSSSSNEDENSWTLAKNRFVKLREFKGKHYIDIREFYTDNNGDLKPGKKGISLTLDQWQTLKNLIEDVDSAIKRTV